MEIGFLFMTAWRQIGVCRAKKEACHCEPMRTLARNDEIFILELTFKHKYHIPLHDTDLMKNPCRKICGRDGEFIKLRYYRAG